MFCVADFVAINAYTINVFAPLNTLGGIYNSIVQYMTDLTNLLELLRLVPEVQDVPNAPDIPLRRSLAGGTAAEEGGKGASIEFQGEVCKMHVILC
jgi:ABC-type transport system involved in Fe-S cluster assembly fused permease/ATPase subunit